MKATEIFARNYLIFRHPTEYVLILFSPIIGVLANLFILRNVSEETGISFRKTIVFNNFNSLPKAVDLILIKQFEVIDTYLLAIKMTNVIIIAFFICYRWSSMQNDGSYGFWLTLGLDKRRFFIITLTKSLILISFGQIIGFAIVVYMNGLMLDLFLIVKIILLMISHNFVLIGIAIFLGNIITNPELSALGYILVAASNMVLNSNRGSLTSQIFQSDIQYNEPTAILSLIYAIVIGLILNIGTLRLHTTFDIDL